MPGALFIVGDLAAMNLYLDMGASWANTLRLGPDLFPKTNGSWVSVAFEASPLIQPFLDEYVNYLNGERPDAPTSCLPRSGSTPHLRRYAKYLDCNHHKNEKMRACVIHALGPHLSALRAKPELNSSALLNARLQRVTQLLTEDCLVNCSKFVAVPAAVDDRNGWMKLSGSPAQLIRGGAKRAALAPEERQHVHTVRTINVVSWIEKLVSRAKFVFRGGAKRAALAPEERQHVHTVRTIDVVSWIEKLASRAKFVFIKMDVEGAEHAILKRMEEHGVHKLVDALALECHDFGGQCTGTLQRIRKWGIRIVDERVYSGMDKQSATETRLPPECAVIRRVQREYGRTWVPPRARHGRCAVVGSAPSLAFLFQGDEIDGHDAVFRTNAHANVGTVGDKTTYRIAANAFQLSHYRRNATSVVQLVPPQRWSIAPGNLVEPQDQVSCVSNATISAIYNATGIWFGTQTLSTGALALGLALQLCNKTSVYGFGGLQSYDHVIRDQHHNWLKELLWVRSLIASGRVQDHTDRGVHARRCKRMALVDAALRKLRGDVYPLLDREHLLEGCPTRKDRGASDQAAEVDHALLKTYG